VRAVWRVAKEQHEPRKGHSGERRTYNALVEAAQWSGWEQIGSDEGARDTRRERKEPSFKWPRAGRVQRCAREESGEQGGENRS
jgi:hypothetical protein